MNKFFNKIIKAIPFVSKKINNIRGVVFEDIISDIIKNHSPVVIDCGANNGQTIEKCLKIFNNPNVYSFEPTPELFNTLKLKYNNNLNITLSDLALSDSNGIHEFITSKNSPTNSILHPNIDKYKELGALKLVEDFTNSKKKIKVKTICFDDWYHKNINSLEIDLFKTDTQGFDYQVLKGAQNTLEKIKVIIAECHFQEFYDNAEPTYEIIKYLYKNNFYIYNILKKNNKIQIHEADIVFVNNNLSLDK